MNDNLSADDAAKIVSRSGRTLRARLRELRDGGVLDSNNAWQDPPQKNGTWTIKRTFLRRLAQENNWPFHDQQG